MYKTKKYVKRLNLVEGDDDIEKYQEIINNPLASIIEEKKARKTEKHFDKDGNPTHTTIIDFLVVSWEERSIL